ncbi:hypothetical protein XM25_07885 [Devosia sp. H5989]|nr:hypothetical protein XM25_07885 [Devosia sp. H5989]
MHDQPLEMADLIVFEPLADAPTIKKSGRRLTIMSTLATGWLPWGIKWDASLTFTCDFSRSDLTPLKPVNYHFVLCCGHTMSLREAQAFVSAGLLHAGRAHHGGEALVITDAGRTWLGRNWIS